MNFEKLYIEKCNENQILIEQLQEFEGSFFLT